jgi:hypothetical protein
MQTRKIIKKLTQSALVLLVIIFSLPAIAYLLLQSSRVQTFATSAAARLLSDKTGSEITVGRVNISFLYRVRLNDVLIEDIHGDTLIYSESLIAGIRSVNPFTPSISFGSIDLNRAFVNFVSDSTGTLNLTYFIEKLKGKSEKKGNGLDIVFSNIRLNDSRFCLIDSEPGIKEYGINFSNLRISELNADLRRFDISGDSVTFRINTMSFYESSGFRLSRMQCDFTQADTLLEFRDVQIETAGSDIQAGVISLSFDNYKMFKPDSLYERVIFNINFERSVLDIYDLAYFAPAFRDARQKFTITGAFSGPLNNIKGNDINWDSATALSFVQK